MERPSVRIRILRSTGDFGHVGAEIEAAITPGRPAVDSLTDGYEIVAGWLELAVEAERLGREIRLERTLLEDAEADRKAAGQMDLDSYGEATIEARRTVAQRSVEEAKARLDAAVARRAELLGRMRDPKFAVISTADERSVTGPA